ncbi:MAG: capsular biosynthesis protein, partial [Bacteroidetes bacterium]|nr:capsular biosynthesis protein [Bacteroidota bacterium]
NIQFVALPVQGGKNILQKFTILWALPKTLWLVHKHLKKADAFQLRTPTGMGAYLIPWLSLFTSKKGWYKYAGNWNQKKPPLGYALQRWFLKNQKRTVTINGAWPGQPKHCLTFENPCLTKEEVAEGSKVIDGKDYNPSHMGCFVGRLEDEKGVQCILETMVLLGSEQFFETFHFIGDGPKRMSYEVFAKTHQLPVKFHGFLARNQVFEIYR